MCTQDTGFNRLLKWVRLCIITVELVPPWKKKSGHYSWMNSSPLPWHLLSVQTSHELYNPLAGFRGQQQRGPVGLGKSLSPWKKKLWHPIFNLIYQCKAKIDSVSLLGRELSGRDVSKPPHFDLARRINTTLYCFNLRGIDFPMLTLCGGTFIIRQA